MLKTVIKSFLLLNFSLGFLITTLNAAAPIEITWQNKVYKFESFEAMMNYPFFRSAWLSPTNPYRLFKINTLKATVSTQFTEETNFFIFTQQDFHYKIAIDQGHFNTNSWLSIHKEEVYVYPQDRFSYAWVHATMEFYWKRFLGVVAGLGSAAFLVKFRNTSNKR